MTLVTGNLFITGHFSGLICLWSADLGKMIDVFENAHTNQITDIIFGNIYGTGFSTGEVWLFFTKRPHDFHILDFDKPNVTLKAGFKPITNLTLGLGLSKEETILIGGSEKVTFVFRV